MAFRKQRLAVIFFSVIVLAGLFLYFHLLGTPPNESKLIENFVAHRTDFERLREMLVTDEQVRAVYVRFGVETTKSGVPRPPLEVNFPVSRYNEYLVLLKQIGTTRVSHEGESDSEFWFAGWATGFGGDTRHVNYCWLERPPVNQVASLKDFYRTPKPRRPVFRHIDGNWYLWADW